ncbi:metallophosphoesterase [Dehalobacter sp. DCM]|uniref:metallophosphoesterase family protein n=1 Tax=Dehalobacter sp. DCM TaxID=2907827 RepID=UPI00308161B9|nr:metallophosphoesterase [Dehalobacter sp. DCM]
MRKVRLLTTLLIGLCCLVVFGCSTTATQSSLSERAPQVKGAVLQSALPADDGIPVYVYRAWQPVIAFDLSSRQKCRIEISNVPAEQMQGSLTGEHGTVDLSQAGVQIQQPLSTKITVAIPKGLQGKLLLQPAAAWGTAGSFAVIGDTQGNNESFQGAIKQINRVQPDFVVHLGDMTASGTEDEYKAFLQTAQQLFCPIYTVPGNHDIKGGGTSLYEKLLAPAHYDFEWGGKTLVFIDDSVGTVSQEQFAYLNGILSQQSKVMIFMHIPAVDPRGAKEDHALTDAAAAKTFLTMVQLHKQNIEAVMNGHIHLFNQYSQYGVPLITSGGGGANLYAEPGAGGYHHWLLVSADNANNTNNTANSENTSLAIKVNRFDPPARRDILTVTGATGSMVLQAKDFDGLFAASEVEGKASFQNQYGNIGGAGTYAGIPIRALLEKVGGMTENNTLVITSVDGYQQTYSYGNVYPEKAGWQEAQGEMILATQWNGSQPPEWQDGYRIVFLTADGLYDNADCSATSAPGEGWDTYASAGARWARYVVRMEVK